MLINTVILFIRDLLPIFILFGYLKAWLPTTALNNKKITLAVICGAISAFAFYYIAEHISDWFNGAGIELSRITLLILFYITFTYILIFIKQKNILSLKQTAIVLLTSISFITVKGSEFLIFFNAYWHQTNSLNNIIIGCAVGLGICASFSLLFNFILHELKQNNAMRFIYLCCCLFAAGQVSHIVDYLTQVDLLPAYEPLFNLSAYIKDSSEYGHILSAILGYESAPSASLVITYVIAFICPLVLRLPLNSTVQSLAQSATKPAIPPTKKLTAILPQKSPTNE